MSAGPDLRYSTTDPAPGSVADRERPYGVEPFGQAGLQAQVVGDWRDHPVAPTAGTRVVLRGRVYPAVWDVVDPFAVLQAVGSIYLTAPVAARPTLAVRAGAERVVGRFPFHEAATVGGSETLRGVTAQRFAGRTSAYGGADLRLRLGEVLVVLPAAVGLLGLVDVARVWADGETSGRWHRSVGGGVGGPRRAGPRGHGECVRGAERCGHGIVRRCGVRLLKGRGRETVIRFAVRDEDAGERLALGPLPLGLRGAAGATQFQRDVYLDTADGVLARRGVSCWLRVEASGTRTLFATVRDAPMGSPSVTRVIEAAVPEEELTAILHGPAEPARLLQAMVDPRALGPVFTLETA
ncbi:MAG: CYTH domain-containing protein, partial [Gemmatimonadales bacterium]